MKSKYKIGDKLYHIQYGWGDVINVLLDNIYNDPRNYIVIKFTSQKECITLLVNASLLNLISFTEYTLEGFSQDRPEELPNGGDIVWIKEDKDQYHWQIGHFYKKLNNMYLVSSGRPDGWYLSGVIMTTKNPYENEHN